MCVNVIIYWFSVIKWSVLIEWIIVLFVKILEEIILRVYIVNFKLFLYSCGKFLFYLNGCNCFVFLEWCNISFKIYWNEEREKYIGIIWMKRNNLGGKLKK